MCIKQKSDVLSSTVLPGSLLLRGAWSRKEQEQEPVES